MAGRIPGIIALHMPNLNINNHQVVETDLDEDLSQTGAKSNEDFADSQVKRNIEIQDNLLKMIY